MKTMQRRHGFRRHIFHSRDKRICENPNAEPSSGIKTSMLMLQVPWSIENGTGLRGFLPATFRRNVARPWNWERKNRSWGGMGGGCNNFVIFIFSMAHLHYQSLTENSLHFFLTECLTNICMKQHFANFCEEKVW